MAKKSPVERTLKYLRGLKYEVDIAEKFNRFAGKFGGRKDLFNFIDLVAITDKDILAVQVCGKDFPEHDRKILAEPRALKWLETGNPIMLIGWRPLKMKRGGKKIKYSPRIKMYEISDFMSVTNGHKSLEIGFQREEGSR